MILKLGINPQFVAHEKDAPLLNKITHIQEVKRAGHVVPASPTLRVVWEQLRQAHKGNVHIEDWLRSWECDWIVDLSRSGGPTLGPFKDRAAAINAEEDWVFSNLLQETSNE